jgi:hypothetical protein
VIGTGTLLWSGENVDVTAMSAPTDGFAVVRIGGPSRPGAASFAYGSIYGHPETWFVTTGGTVGSFTWAWARIMSYNYNSACVPIPKGSTWAYYAANSGGNQENSPIYVYWFPLVSTSSQQMPETVSPAELEGLGLTAPEPPVIDLAGAQAEREAAADAFVTRFAGAVGADLDADTKAALAAELLRM